MDNDFELDYWSTDGPFDVGSMQKRQQQQEQLHQANAEFEKFFEGIPAGTSSGQITTAELVKNFGIEPDAADDSAVLIREKVRSAVQDARTELHKAATMAELRGVMAGVAKVLNEIASS